LETQQHADRHHDKAEAGVMGLFGHIKREAAHNPAFDFCKIRHRRGGAPIRGGDRSSARHFSWMTERPLLSPPPLAP
jgi:hypothetical protein